MRKKWVVLLLVVLGMGLFGAAFGHGLQLAQASMQTADLDIKTEIGEQPPLGCHYLRVEWSPYSMGPVNVNPPPDCGDIWYTAGTVVTLTAVTTASYNFLQWNVTPPVSGTMSPTLVLTMDNDYTADANFNILVPPPPGCRLLIYDKDLFAGGEVSVSHEPNCGATWYIDNEIVTLTAVPNSGYVFLDWSGTVITTDPVLNISMSVNHTVTANFTSITPPPGCRLLQYSANPPGGGTVTVSPEPNCGAIWYVEGEVVTMTALPNPGFEFQNWGGSVAGLPGSDNPVMMITMDQNHSAIANFLAEPCYQVDGEVSPVNSGVVDFLTPQNCPGGYTPDFGFQLQATPNVGFVFDHWETNQPATYPIYQGSTQNPLLVQSGTLVSDVTFTAVFTQPVPSCYDIFWSTNPPNEGVVVFTPPRGTDCPGGWIAGNVTITALVNDPTAYEFDSWSSSTAPIADPLQPVTTMTVDDNETLTLNLNQIADVADLYIQKSDSADPSPFGQPLTYTLIVGNNGPDFAGDVRVQDSLPVSLIPISATPSQGSCSIGGNTVNCTIGFLPAGNSTMIEIVVIPNSAGLIQNTAFVFNNDPTQIDTNPANDSDSETTQIDEAPIGGLTADNDSPTPLGGTTTLTASVASGTGVSYTWDFGDGNSGMGDIATHTYTATGTYTATVVASNTVSMDTAETVVIVEEAIGGLTAENDSPTALGSTTTLSASVTGGSNVTYTWDFGDGNGGSGQNVGHSYAAPGVYTATVTASNTVSLDTAETIVLVEEAISGLAAHNDSPTTLGMTTTLTATISAGSNVSFSWDFGDGSGGVGIVATHIYTASGTFTATVTAFNAVGAQIAMTTVVIEVPVYEIYIPMVAGKPQ